MDLGLFERHAYQYSACLVFRVVGLKLGLITALAFIGLLAEVTVPVWICGGPCDQRSHQEACKRGGGTGVNSLAPQR